MMEPKKVSTHEAKRVDLPGDSYLRELLTGATAGTKKAMLGVSVFKPGFKSKSIVHTEDELAYITKGEGKLVTPNHTLEYGEGDALYIPAGTVHMVVNSGNSDLSMVYVFTFPEYPPTKTVD
jgi:quercetin dioxygenase-like cupin family protein